MFRKDIDETTPTRAPMTRSQTVTDNPVARKQVRHVPPDGVFELFSALIVTVRVVDTGGVSP